MPKCRGQGPGKAARTTLHHRDLHYLDILRFLSPLPEGRASRRRVFSAPVARVPCAPVISATESQVRCLFEVSAGHLGPRASHPAEVVQCRVAAALDFVRGFHATSLKASARERRSRLSRAHGDRFGTWDGHALRAMRVEEVSGLLL